MIRDDMFIYELPHYVKINILLEARKLGLKGLELREILNSKVNGLVYDIPVKAIYYNFTIENKNDYYNLDAFKQYLADEFPSVGFNNSFLRELIDNIVEYAIDHKSHTLEEMSYFISDLLPEIDFSEIRAFDSTHYKLLENDISVKYGNLDEVYSIINRHIESAGITGNKMYSDQDVYVLLNKARNNQAIFNKYADEYASGHDLVVLKSAVDNWDFSVEDFNRYDSDVKEQFIRIMQEAEPEMDKQVENFKRR